MRYFFLIEDFAELNKKIRSITNRIKSIGQEMGASCEECAETYHDNFAFEDGERQQRMWSNQLCDLIEIQRFADIFRPSGRFSSVRIGCKVTISDVSTGEEKCMKIGSYMNFAENGAVSYNAPLPRMLLGKKVGDICKGIIGGQLKQYEIVELC
jgi:transcription elongation GreA/GreB family factor